MSEEARHELERLEKVIRQQISRRKFVGVGAGAIGLAGLLAACGDNTATSAPAATSAATTGAATTAAAAATKKPKVGLVMKSLANEFFMQMQSGAEEYAKANADKFDFKAVGMKDERDFAAQVDAVENFITQKYDIIVVAPADSKAMVTPLAKAVKQGIVVINIDVELDAEAKKAAGIDLAFFGPDNAAGAKMAGDALAKALGQGGKVVILEGNPEADNAQQRKKGFDAAVAEGKLTLLDSKTAHWETEEANTLMTNFLTKYQDIQGVMAANDSMVLGVVKALDAAGKSGKIKVVGFDNIPAVQPLIKSGKVLATIEQYGAKMAVFGIDYGMRTLKGEKFTGWIKTDIKLIMAQDLT
ncbi:MAG TPA: sugar ABC transporter substrate-binding protein [Chloroflexia bacterium]|nr:sugar ABC transporter substrate-binding protein [Chloroflexia bacterium]